VILTGVVCRDPAEQEAGIIPTARHPGVHLSSIIFHSQHFIRVGGTRIGSVQLAVERSCDGHQVRQRRSDRPGSADDRRVTGRFRLPYRLRGLAADAVVTAVLELESAADVRKLTTLLRPST
jgi:hypothetical protein